MNPSAPESPPRIPDYEMLRRIGGGSYGSVWLARTATGIFRAVKVVWRDDFEDAEPYEREFRGLREFERVSLSESRQLALLHVGRREEEGFFYYVMELADDVERGREIDPATYRPFTLRELAKADVLPAARVVELAVELARGLAVLHDRGLVHRDIKPSNVILVEGAPKLADIGLVTASTLALTFVGTEGFVAPEGPGSPAADVYALGKVIYELATGLDRLRFPTLPEDFAERTDRAAFLELNAVILRACDPNLARRQPDARALLEDLLMIQAGKSVRRLWAAERGLARALKMVAVLAAVTGVAGAGAWVAWNRAEQEMALRAEAEAERNALRVQAQAERDAWVRRTQYVSLLDQASRAVWAREYGLSRRLLASARDLMPGEAQTIEQRWLRSASWGNVEQVLCPRGPSIKRIAIDAQEQHVAVVDSSENLTIYALESGRRVLEVPQVSDLGGWTTDGGAVICTDHEGQPWLVTLDGRRASSLVSAVGSTRPPLPKNVTPLGLDRRGLLLGVEQSDRFGYLRYDPADGTWTEQDVSRDWDQARTWNVFDHCFSPDQAWAAVAWVSGSGPDAEYWLEVVEVDSGKVMVLPTALKAVSLGWIRSLVGTLELEVVDRYSGAVDRWTPFTGKWSRQRNGVATGSRASWMLEEDGAWRTARASGTMLTLESGAGREVLCGPTGEVGWVAWAPRHRVLLGGTTAGEVLRWSFDPRMLPRQIARVKPFRPSLRFAISAEKEGDYLIPDEDHGVRLVDRQGRERGSWPGVWWVWQAVRGGLVGVDADARSVVVVDPRSGAVTWRTEQREERIVNVVASADGSRLVYTRTDNTIWRKLRGGADELVVRSPNSHWGLQMDEEGRLLWCTTQQREVVAWDLDERRQRWSTRMPNIVAHVDRSKSRGLVVAAVTNGELLVLDEESGRIVRRLESGSPKAEIVVVDDARGRVLVGGSDGAVHLFDLDDWRELGTFHAPETSSCWTLQVSESGDRLAVLTADGRLVLVAEDRPDLFPSSGRSPQPDG